MIKIEGPKVLDVKTLKRNVSNLSVILEKGDEVQIIGIGERGYDIMEVSSGITVFECGWDLFED